MPLNWPKRTKTNFKYIDLEKVKELSFFDINSKTFPSLVYLNIYMIIKLITVS